MLLKFDAFYTIVHKFNHSPSANKTFFVFVVFIFRSICRLFQFYVCDNDNVTLWIWMCNSVHNLFEYRRQFDETTKPTTITQYFFPCSYFCLCHFRWFRFQITGSGLRWEIFVRPTPKLLVTKLNTKTTNGNFITVFFHRSHIQWAFTRIDGVKLKRKFVAD